MAKRAGVDGQFCVVPKKSIKLLGESLGISYLPDEVTAILAEDASYRIRQIIQNANQFVKHSKRDHITGGDINRALFWSHVEPIYGYGSKNSTAFSSMSTKDGDLFFHEDKEINLKELTFSKGFSTLSDIGNCKLIVEVSMLDMTSAHESDGSGDIESSTTKIQEFHKLNPVLKLYFNQTTINIIRANRETAKVILDDLRMNPRIQILLPYLVNFIITAMQGLREDMVKVLRLFDMIKALVDNKRLYLEPYVVQLVRAVMYCLIEKPCSKGQGYVLDDWSLRNISAQTLCHINRKCSNASNFLRLQLVQTLKDVYHADDRPLHCLYGAVTGLTMLGTDTIVQTILPHLKEFIDNLVTLKESNPPPHVLIEILYIFEMLKVSTMSVLRNKFKSLIAIMRQKKEHLQKSRGGQKMLSNASENTFKPSEMETKLFHEMYEQMYDVTGDALVLILGTPEDYENFTRCKAVSPTRTSMVGQTRVQHVRKMIQSAWENRTQKARPSVSFSLLGEKTRRFRAISIDEKQSPGYLDVLFLDNDNSELRFENLLENSMRRKKSCDCKGGIVSLPCLGAKRKLPQKSIASLNL